MNMLWAPGQSDAAKDICRHLTQREKVSLLALSVLFGLCAFVLAIGLLGLATGAGPLHGYLQGFGFPLLFCLAAGLFVIIGLQRRVLLSTKTAKEKGYSPSDITAREPLNGRDNLILIGVAVVAVVISLAAAYFAV